MLESFRALRVLSRLGGEDTVARWVDLFYASVVNDPVLAPLFPADLGESKAALEVDRYEADILRDRHQAVEAGVTSAPALVTRTGTLQGFHNQAAIGTLLDGR